MTFSIAARCPRTGMLGVATSSATLACGSWAPSVQANTGAIASQAIWNPFFGLDGLRLLAKGLSPEQVVAELVGADPGSDLRQLLVVDARGRAVGFTGGKCIPWHGHQTGAGYVAGGNMLVGKQVVTDMAAAFEGAEQEELPERVVRALEAGEAAGGDRRGGQSAALIVAHDQDYRYFDLRVDDHQTPVTELRRVFERVRELRKADKACWGNFRPTREAPLPPGFLDRWPAIEAEFENEKAPAEVGE